MFAFIVGTAASALIKPHEEKAFIAHMRTHNLVYTGDEYQFRLGLYLANARFVREHNSKSSFRVGLNRFATYTPTEYNSLLGSRRSRRENPVVATTRLEHPPTNRRKLSGNPPASFDYREVGAVNPIKDQGTCGAGWAFAEIATQESQWFITNQVLYSLSEQNLLDCIIYFNDCYGGSAHDANNYVINSQNGQFALESDYPYKGSKQDCKWDASMGITKVVSEVMVRFTDEFDLLNRVYYDGPASAEIDASSVYFQLYTGGVYDDPTCSAQVHNHVVAVIGWGVNNGTPYWLVRNSWGIGWGIDGYIWMIRNKQNQCGIASSAMIPIDVL
jgi:cathepsin L